MVGNVLVEWAFFMRWSPIRIELLLLEWFWFYYRDWNIYIIFEYLARTIH